MKEISLEELKSNERDRILGTDRKPDNITILRRKNIIHYKVLLFLRRNRTY